MASTPEPASGGRPPHAAGRPGPEGTAQPQPDGRTLDHTDEALTLERGRAALADPPAGLTRNASHEAENVEWEHENSTVILADGRRIGYAEWGDADGRPLLYFHGWPGSRLEGRLGAEAARASGVRLVALDRPGMGLSDRLPRRRLIDWPSDVAAVADALGLRRFAVLGISGGGPYAVACARMLADRLIGVGVVSSLAPMDAPGVTAA